MNFDSKDPARKLAKQLNCPTCSHRPESFFADGTVCPTCGRKKSLILEALGMTSSQHNNQQADEEIKTLDKKAS